MNVKDYNTIEALDRIIDLAESGRELTDEELASLMQDEESMRAYREMMLMKTAVCQEVDQETPDIETVWEKAQEQRIEQSADEENTETETVTRWFVFHPKYLKYAAACILLVVGVGLWYMNNQKEKGYLAFERIDEVPEIIVTADGKDHQIEKNQNTTASSNERQQISPSTLLSREEDGKLVLDYARAEGYAVSSEVESHTATIPPGKDLKIVLADGSEVFLYADSKLTYPSHFVGKERRVVLRGQAYFRVAKDAAHPFIIHTEDFEARVLGTELNVCSYGKGNGHVALVNGSVMVKHASSKDVVLRPGQTATLNSDNQLVVKEENMDSYVYWLKGYIFFDDAPLLEVAQALGRWYNVNVRFMNDSTKDKHIRYYCLRNESIHHAISLLNGLKDFQVELKDNTLYIK